MAPDPGRPLIVSLGEALIDLVADGQAASVEGATTFHKAAGGAPANVAVGLARLGQRVAFVGKLADDEFGRFLRRTLETEAVDVTGLVIDPAARTPLAFVGAGSTSERRFVFYHEGMADTLLRADELHRDLIGRARVFHFGSVTLAGEPGRSATIEAARQARDSGALVTFDPNVRLELWPRQDEARGTIVGGDARRPRRQGQPRRAAPADRHARARGRRTRAAVVWAAARRRDAWSRGGVLPDLHRRRSRAGVPG